MSCMRLSAHMHSHNIAFVYSLSDARTTATGMPLDPLDRLDGNGCEHRSDALAFVNFAGCASTCKVSSTLTWGMTTERRREHRQEQFHFQHQPLPHLSALWSNEGHR